MNTLTFSSVKINDRLSIPYSKSYLNRLLILASLKPGMTKIKGNSQARDVRDLIKCLKNIGLIIRETSNEIYIENSFPDCEAENNGVVELEPGEGGTTTRFLLALLARGTNKYKVVLNPELKKRPMDELYRLLRDLDCEIGKEERITVKGPINISLEVEVDCSESTQFASALMLVGCRSIILKNVISSKKYLDLTQRLISQGDLTAELDSSSLVYLYVYSLLNEKTFLSNYKRDLEQADQFVLDSLEHCEYVKDGIFISKRDSQSCFSIDLNHCLDAGPALAYLASYSEGTSVLKNCHNLRHKECDRLRGIMKALDQFSINYSLKGNDLYIEGTSKVQQHQIVCEPENDHRIVMMYFLFLSHNSGGTLNQIEAVKKSFPGFLDNFEVLD